MNTTPRIDRAHIARVIAARRALCVGEGFWVVRPPLLARRIEGRRG